jgi:transposase
LVASFKKAFFGSKSEKIDPAQFWVIVARRPKYARCPKYACRSCEGRIVQAPAPVHTIAGGLPTEATLAHVLVSKYAIHLPLYRQAQIYNRPPIDLDRSTLEITFWDLEWSRVRLLYH